MSKITVIIRHEYFKRIKAKWFLLSTLLAPFGIALLIMIPVLAAVFSGEGQEEKVVFVDATDTLAQQIVAADTAAYELAGGRTIAELETQLKNETIQAYVIIPNTVLEKPEVVMYSLLRVRSSPVQSIRLARNSVLRLQIRMYLLACSLGQRCRSRSLP